MIDADERELLQASVHAALADVGSEADAAVDAVLARIGWRELLSAEPREAIAIVFAALGESGAACSSLDDVLAWALGAEPRADLAVLLPEFGAWQPPGSIASGQLAARGLGSSRTSSARELLVVCAQDGKLCAAIAPLESADRRAVRGIDPELSLHALQVCCDPREARPLDGAAWEAALAAGRRALAHQIAGACRSMLGLARSHALERQQFGRPIARFQAVRHRLAEALVAVEALESVAAAADECADPMAAALAKATAGSAARSVARHCQQVLAGIGFTTEHAFQRFFKRSLSLDGLLGSTSELSLWLGRELLASRRVPVLIEL